MPGLSGFRDNETGHARANVVTPPPTLVNLVTFGSLATHQILAQLATRILRYGEEGARAHVQRCKPLKSVTTAGRPLILRFLVYISRNSLRASRSLVTTINTKQTCTINETTHLHLPSHRTGAYLPLTYCLTLALNSATPLTQMSRSLFWSRNVLHAFGTRLNVHDRTVLTLANDTANEDWVRS